MAAAGKRLLATTRRCCALRSVTSPCVLVLAIVVVAIVSVVVVAVVLVVVAVATWISVRCALAAWHCTTHYFMAYHMCTL